MKLIKFNRNTSIQCNALQSIHRRRRQRWKHINAIYYLLLTHAIFLLRSFVQKGYSISVSKLKPFASELRWLLHQLVHCEWSFCFGHYIVIAIWIWIWWRNRKCSYFPSPSPSQRQREDRAERWGVTLRRLQCECYLFNASFVCTRNYTFRNCSIQTLIKKFNNGPCLNVVCLCLALDSNFMRTRYRTNVPYSNDEKLKCQYFFFVLQRPRADVLGTLV